MRSAIELVEHSINNNDDKRADIFIFPILHNFNHGVELYLKGLIWKLNLLLKNKKDREGKHNIRQLYLTLKARISKYKNGEYLKYFNVEFTPLKTYIDELFTQTNGNDQKDQMDFSRYPLNNKDDEHFYIVTGKNVEIDLTNLYERYAEIYRVFEQAEDFLYWIEYKNKI